MSQPAASLPRTQRALNSANRYFFLKKGYAFLSHVVPFGVASLLLLTLSLPGGDLLSAPHAVAVPALFLTGVALTVYVFSVRTQIRRAYLDGGNHWLRALVTAAVFIALATGMAWLVLDSTGRPAGGLSAQVGRAWACLLVALLSLTGIGWSTPSTWHERVGVELPDYRKARGMIDAIARSMAEIRASTVGTPLQRDGLAKAFDDLAGELRQNLRLEPRWARPPLQEAEEALQAIAARFKSDFAEANVPDLPAALRGEKDPLYPSFVPALAKVQDSFRAWNRATTPATPPKGLS